MSTVASESSGKLARRVQDSSRRLRDFEARLRGATSPRERAELADIIVPEYVSVGDSAKAAEVIDSIVDTGEPNLDARITALRAIVEAMHGNNPDAILDRAFQLVQPTATSTMAVVHHRAGVAYLSARRSSDAQKHALQGLWLADSNGERSIAARAASVLYAVNYHLTDDLQAARYYAELAAVEATAAGEMAIRRLFLCAQLDFAISFGEWDRARSLVDLLRRDKWYDAHSGGQAAQAAI